MKSTSFSTRTQKIIFKMAINIKMKDNIDKIETIKIHKKILNPAENKTIISTSPFFYEKSRLLWFTGISELW